MGAVQRLIAAVAEGKAQSDAAIAALRLGLEQTQRRLNTTATEVRNEADEAAVDTRVRIAKGLAELRANFSSSMAKQQVRAHNAAEWMGGEVGPWRVFCVVCVMLSHWSVMRCLKAFRRCRRDRSASLRSMYQAQGLRWRGW